MKIVSNKEFCIATTDVRGINCKEMRQMHELKQRIAAILDSHESDEVRNESINPLFIVFKGFIFHLKP